jgi:hypothetical protein
MRGFSRVGGWVGGGGAGREREGIERLHPTARNNSNSNDNTIMWLVAQHMLANGKQCLHADTKGSPYSRVQALLTHFWHAWYASEMEDRLACRASRSCSSADLVDENRASSSRRAAVAYQSINQYEAFAQPAHQNPDRLEITLGNCTNKSNLLQRAGAAAHIRAHIRTHLCSRRFRSGEPGQNEPLLLL